MKGLIIEAPKEQHFYVFALNNRGYAVGKRKVSFHQSEGLGFAKEWLHENYDIPYGMIAVEVWNGANAPDDLSWQAQKDQLEHTYPLQPDPAVKHE